MWKWTLLISSEVQTTEPLTTEPLTPEPLTTEPLTTESLTPEPLTTESITTEPITTEPLTTESITTESITTEPLTTEPQTTEIEKTNGLIESEILPNVKKSYEETDISQETEGINSENIIEKCDIEEIKENNCTLEISNEQVKEIYTFIKDNLIKKNETMVIKAGNTIFEISTTNEQKNINNENISNIDLGQCEVELKKK